MISQNAKQITPAELLKKVQETVQDWHHHCLTKSCFANDTGQDIIVLELKFSNYWCVSTDRLKRELEERADSLSGQENYQKQNDLGYEALELVRKYVQAGTRWHFHFAMPHCLLNDLDHYLLILENDETGDRKQWHFDKKPVGLVRTIDDYYLGRVLS